MTVDAVARPPPGPQCTDVSESVPHAPLCLECRNARLLPGSEVVCGVGGAGRCSPTAVAEPRADDGVNHRTNSVHASPVRGRHPHVRALHAVNVPDQSLGNTKSGFGKNSSLRNVYEITCDLHQADACLASPPRLATRST